MHMIVGLFTAFISIAAITIGGLAFVGALAAQPAAVGFTLLLFLIACKRAWRKASIEVDRKIAISQQQTSRALNRVQATTYTSNSLDDPIDDEELF